MEQAANRIFERFGGRMAPLRMLTRMFGRSNVMFVPRRAILADIVVSSGRVLICSDLAIGAAAWHQAATVAALHLPNHSRTDITRAAAALLMPRDELAEVIREFGADPEVVAAHFGVHVSAAGLRLGEALGVPTALLANDRLYTRGRPYDWPTSPFELLRLARSLPKGLTASDVTDEPGRRVLLTAG